ncbi:primosomal replication protein N [Chitinivorax sp. B]|uniref:primosomal replication protein N n=1 Tax=Chitinivorax sp. B TaxID=2502235 RepID=UPI0010F6185B|nr:primosomal replication protein N [Chitinivorax sp. B]
MSCNHVELEGVIAECDTLRYTPAGIPIIGFNLSHISQQQEAGVTRSVKCMMPSLALGDIALEASRLRENVRVKLSGFLAMKNLKSTQLVLHVTRIEYSQTR